jgi:hypothetical protein
MAGTSAPVEIERGGWEGSEISLHEVETFRATRKLPMEVECRIPDDEIFPAPKDGEYVVLGAHFTRGFGLPASGFFREFLDRFKLQPHHLPANSIIALSSFVTFCEGYLGLEPTVDLWAAFFYLRPSVQQGVSVPVRTAKPLNPCGSAIVIPRLAGPWPKVTCIDTVRKWQRTFFYVKNPSNGADLINLPAYSAVTPPASNSERDYWRIDVNEEDEEISQALARLKGMKDAGLIGEDLVLTYLSRRVSPLQRRLHKICYMSGAMDATRHTTFELDQAAVYRRLCALIKPAIKADWKFGLAAYSRDNPVPQVRLFLSGIIFLLLACSFLMPLIPAY